MKSAPISVLFDRIEGRKALLVDEGGRIEITIDAALLPPDLREGDRARITIEHDAAGTAAAVEKNARLLKELTGG